MAIGGRGPLSIEDARGADATLRVTWHAEQRKVVLSHWHGARCTASTAVDVEAVPQLISALVAALGQAAAAPSGQDEKPHPPAEAFRELWRSLVHRVRREMASVVPISAARPPAKGTEPSDPDTTSTA